NSDLVETLERLDIFVNGHPEQDIRIGVTSRNGRLLNKDQLIGEASSALKRTSSDNRIIGFRADPERYRESLG
ncbi:MAG: GGDEF domain-containing protein, partial [Spirochaetales bacterium]|nr:GGDEF domain-containing protein [Spirochaetales bacterium]